MTSNKADGFSKIISAVLGGIAEIIQALAGAAGILMLVGIPLYFWLGDGFNSGEREGTVDYSDCREKIPLSEDRVALSKWYQSYTCTYERTQKGRIAGGFCVHIDYDKNQGCKVAYFYKRSAEKLCTDPKYPLLGLDDLCYSAAIVEEK